LVAATPLKWAATRRSRPIARQLRFRPADVDAFVEANAITGADL
jgi:hypothetical protein